MSLRMLLLEVFNIPSSRLVTPDWANTPRFNIYAKLPEGATEDQVPGMFLSLLEERFGLTYHVEVRDGPVLALVAAQGGMKMKPATSDSELPAWVATAASEPYRDRNMRGVRFRSMAAPGSDGNAEILQSPSMGWVRKSALVPPDYGVVYYQAPSISMEGLAALATIADDGLDAVVVDRTGLRGRYQVNLGISLGDLAAYFLDALRGLAAPQDPQLKVVQSGLKQLGLELQPARAPLETFVVDHLEKTPMGN